MNVENKALIFCLGFLFVCKTGSHTLVLTFMRPDIETRMAFRSHKSACLSPLTARMKDLPHCIRLELNFYLSISLLTCNKYFVPLCHLWLPRPSQLLQFHWQADFFDWMLYLHILALYWVTIRLTGFISCFISDWAFLRVLYLWIQCSHPALS